MAQKTYQISRPVEKLLCKYLTNLNTLRVQIFAGRNFSGTNVRNLEVQKF